MSKLLSYNNDTKLKKNLIREMQKHRKADQFVKGTYGKDNGLFKGCSVGCAVHSLNRIKKTTIAYNDHLELSKAMGCPEWLWRLNDTLFENLPNAKRNYQFELCEKMVLRLPEKFKNKSIVVLDGPFFCIDPYSDTGFHVMGNVVHAIHVTNVGHFPHIPEEFRPLMNRGIVKNPSVTNVEKLLESASYFMPEIRKAEHIGSMFTLRTVLPDVDHTDERPTLVTRVNDKIINVFSGKLGNCVEAAEEVLNLVKESARTF